MHTAPDLPMSGQPADAEIAFSYQPGPEARADLAREFDLQALKKARLEGRVVPEGQADWRLEAKLGATAVQTCVVTLGPVTTRIDAPVTRLYLADPAPMPEAGEVEIPEDDSVEPLGETIDLHRLFAEALALALPDFPRAPDATLETQVFTTPGKTPMGDADIKPFAGLKALRDRQSGPDDTDG
ncbi:MAG: YceD family protein [Pseudomonadota bacterium]